MVRMEETGWSVDEVTIGQMMSIPVINAEEVRYDNRTFP